MSFGADWRRRPLTGDDGVAVVRSFVVQVSPGYFETLSVPLVAGRDFIWTDDRGQRDVAIVSEGLAKRVVPRCRSGRTARPTRRPARPSLGGDWRGGGRQARRAARDEPGVSLYGTAAGASTSLELSRPSGVAEVSACRQHR